jgi:DNA-binding transcriptional ArsR family regulator
MSDRTRRRGKPAVIAAVPPRGEGRTYLHVNPERDLHVVRGLASPVRIRILKLLGRQGALNVNQISEALQLPQSTIATNVQVLEGAELVRTEVSKGRKGQQKICAARFDEIIIALDSKPARRNKNVIEVEMPLGLYTSCKVSVPCGLCSTESVIGVLDVPDLFLDPARVKTALLWFGRGYVEYQFPHQPLGQRDQDRHLDVTGRFRRSARPLHARLVEARRLAVWRVDHLAYQRARHLPGRHQGVTGHSGSCGRRSIIPSACALASTSGLAIPAG